MSNSNNKPNGGDLDSWSIPKKSSQSTPKQPSTGSNIEPALPRKSSSINPDSSGTMLLSIPRKNHPTPPEGGSSEGGLLGSIPRKYQSGSASESKPLPLSGMGSATHINPPSMDAHIPKREGHSSKSHDEQKPRSKSGSNKYNIISEDPFCIRIDLQGVDLTGDGIRQQRATPAKPPARSASGRQRARHRPDYNDPEDFDSEEDFLVDSSGDDAGGDDDDEDHDYGKSKKKKSTGVKKIKVKKGRKSPMESPAEAATSAVPTSVSAAIKAQLVAGPSLDNIDAIPATAFLDLGDPSVESPPPGTLSTLWYSREVFVHVFVVEKILAWKTRHVTQLEWIPESYTEETKPSYPPTIDSAEAAKYSNMALVNPLIWRDPSGRMEVSRLNHQHCPVVMTMAAEAQVREYEQLRKDRNTELMGNPTDVGQNDSSSPMQIDVIDQSQEVATQQHDEMVSAEAVSTETSQKTESGSGLASQPRYRIKHATEGTSVEREEVYLVKWRGKSHLHVSWERGSDIIRYDQSNSTARSKIQRFVQSQELAFGPKWKDVLEDERSAGANAHLHGEIGKGEDDASSDVGDEEYYPPAVTEVERILACDESEMDLSLYAKQRAINILDEQDRVQEKENWKIKRWNSKEGLADLLTEMPWDPEDNVRFVVKWKGLPFADLTWEYWRDIKRDAVDEAEDFWIRQTPPTDEAIAESSRPHPHMQLFKKIQESPVYGISQQKRPIADSIDGRKVPTEEEIEPEGFRLRSYQLEGVNWLLFNWWNKRSCILADEMGLGKTIQSVGFLKVLQDLPATKIRGPFLIVAPLSLIGQWQSEAKSWAPDLNVVLYHGRADARDFVIKQDFFYTDQFVSHAQAKKLRKKHVTKFHILITTYEVVLKDIDVFTKIKWRTLIVDEAHRLKNPKAKLFEELSSVPRDHCVLLTGTPLANATEELWALLHFANPLSFPSKDEFLEKFGQLTDASQVDELHSVLKPYLLRRVKEDVEKSLPPKEETILEVTLTPIQKRFYKAIYERNTSFLFKGAKPSNSPSLMNVMMELRKCCNHPFLIRGAEERILADATELAKSAHADGKGPEIDHYKIFAEQLVKSSGKMVLLNKLLPKLFANGHKVLIFSQMVRALDLMEELLKINRYKYERLDGSTSSSSRAAAVDRFVRKSCQRFVMLLSTRAGGLGLNLTCADVVIIADSDWNPQNDLQAMARAHRIGQTRAVRVYRLLTAKTYEMHMFHSASMKLGLERAVLSQQRDQGNDGGDGSKSKSKQEKEAQAKEIDALLKKGAYDVFRDDNDEEAKKFMETDIDQLMESSAKTVTYGKQQSNLSSGLGSFSKASFVTDTGDGEKDVDLDDPDFWSKAVGLDRPVEIPEEISQMLDDGVKRSRKQVQQFDPYAEWVEEEDKRQAEIDRKIQEEKEEKQRLKAEKKRLKEKKRKEREGNRGAGVLHHPFKKTKHDDADADDSIGSPATTGELEGGNLVPASSKSILSKKGSHRKRAIMRMEQSDPAIEQLKQAWDVTHRNKAVAACLRFGLSRYSKIRHESGLQSLPIQDVEIFCRQYVFQQSLQSAVLFMESLSGAMEGVSDQSIKLFLQECLGPSSAKELEFLSQCLSEGIRYFLEVESQRRFLRLPQIFAEAGYMADLRKGSALRALRRIHLVCRVERLLSDCFHDIVDELGFDQLAQRGCQTRDLSSLGLDLTSRLVSMEELMISLNKRVTALEHNAPATWWDRVCDLGLIIGTFIHGLGNYESMLNDESLPFANKIINYVASDNLSSDAHKRFVSSASATKSVCDAALEASKLKAQKEVQKAVAAAAAASSEREKDAAKLREGVADESLISNMKEQKIDNLYEIEGGHDAHFITLARTRSALISALHCIPMPSADLSDPVSRTSTKGPEELKMRRRSRKSRLSLSMPDARILNFRLRILLSSIDNHFYGEKSPSDGENALLAPETWPASDVVGEIWNMRRSAAFKEETVQLRAEYAGIGMAGTQCGAIHRTIDDRSDFSIAAANQDLYQVARGPDSARYLRALGVPMLFSKFALVALVHAEERCLLAMLNNEKMKYFGEDSSTKSAETDGLHEEELPDKSNSPEKQRQSHSGEVQDTSVSENREMEEEHPPTTTGGIENMMNPLATAPDKPTSGERVAIVIPRAFKENAALRAGLCILICYFGFPSPGNDGGTVHHALWQSNVGFEEGSVYEPARFLFQPRRFRSLLEDQCKGIEIPEWSVIVEYVEKAFLPHCLKLSVYGNGSSTTDARGSKGKYETFDGSSRYIEPTEMLQSPLPDPCLPLKEQSIEAVGMACAILRRYRLMHCLTNVASGAIPFEDVLKVLKSPIFRQSMDGLPVWWCPWIHDLALLVHAGTRGLFAIVDDRRKGVIVHGTPFSRDAVMQHVRSTFFSDETPIPKSVTSTATPDDVSVWIETCANEFPSMNVIERRLAFLCALATERLSGDKRFHNLPMFDHGAWPRN